MPLQRMILSPETEHDCLLCHDLCAYHRMQRGGYSIYINHYIV